jgi:hypothetical protein
VVYCAFDNEIRGASTTHGEYDKCIQNVVRKSEGDRYVGGLGAEGKII